MNKPLLLLFLASSLAFFSQAQAPTGLSGTAFRSTVRLQWNEYTAFQPVGYNVYRSNVSNSFGAAARRIGVYNDYTDYGLTPGTTYYFKVSAFDAAGTESAHSSQITVTTNNNNYLKVASLDVLIPIYLGGMTPEEPGLIQQSLEFARQFFFRNTKGQLNLKFHFVEYPGYPPPNANGVADFETIGTDLHNRGILDNQYDAIHIAAHQLYGWYGGAWWLGQTAGSMAHFPIYSFDPTNHYTSGDAWVFTHEFGHALDLVIAQGSNFPEMVGNHFDDLVPLPAGLPVPDTGTDFDIMAYILRAFNHYLEFTAPWDGYVEVQDSDGDKLANSDPRLPFDEADFGSSPFTDDSDLDGLTDLQEFYAGNFIGSNPNAADTDGDSTPDATDPYPISNFKKTLNKTTSTVTIDGNLAAAEGWQTLASNPFFSKSPGTTLSSSATWDDNYLYFAFQSNTPLKYYLNLDGSGEDGVWFTPVKFANGDYTTTNENSFGESYFETAALIIRSDATQVVLKGVPIAGSQVTTTTSGGVLTTEVRMPHNLGPGYGYCHPAIGAPVMTTQSYTTNDILGVNLVALPLANANGNETGEWRSSNMISMNEVFHFYDMTLTGGGGGGGGGTPCASKGDFPWEDWIAGVSVGSFSNPSGKSQYSDFTNQTINLTQNTPTNITLTTGFSYFTHNEYWRVWIDYNHDGVFSTPDEVVQQQILNAPPTGTPTASISGSITVPISALTGMTKMRVSMKRGAFPSSCETFPFGEVEDYSVNISTGGGGSLADLELTASANPTTIGSGTVHYQLSLTNKGPALANGITVKHSPGGNFANYDNVVPTAGMFTQSTRTWSIGSLGANVTVTLDFDGQIVDMTTPQTDFFEVMTATPGDPDSPHGNDLGAKTPNEDDEAAVNLTPLAGGLPDLTTVGWEVIPGSNCFTPPGSPYVFLAGLVRNPSQVAVTSPFVVKTWLSKDQVIGANDILWQTLNYPGIGPDAVASLNINSPVPPSTPPGMYYILVKVDADNAVNESDEANNIFNSGLQKIGTPDFAFQNLNGVPASLPAGGNLGFSVQVKNLATFPLSELSGSLTFDVILSTDNVFGGSNDLTIGTESLNYSEFNAAGVATRNVSLPVPGSLAPGTYFVILRLNVDCEANFQNNTLVGPSLNITGGTPGSYCASTSNFPWEDWIAKVQFGSINNPSGKSNYSNFTNLTTNLPAGASTPIQLTTGYSYFTYDEYWRVWIDLNHDGDFSDAGEMVFEGIKTKPSNGTPTATLNGNLNIPASVATGATRMRVSMKRGAYATPCETLPFGEVEDYSVNIGGGGGGCSVNFTTSNVQCQNNNTPLNPFDDGFTFEMLVTGTGVGQNWQMTWNGGSTSGTYGVAKTIGPLSISTFQGGFNFSIADAGQASCSTSGSLTPPSPCSNPPSGGNYCFGSSDFPWHDWIARVQLGTLDNASAKSGYSDFTALSVNLQKNQSYPVTFTAGFSWETYNEYFKAWIDFNHDGVFSSPDEVVQQQIINAPALGTQTASVSGSINISDGALLGPTRMRVTMKRGAYASPCGTFSFGEVEDYTINIVQGANGDLTGERADDLGFEAVLDQMNVRLYGAFNLEENVTTAVFEKSADGIDFQELASLPAKQSVVQTLDEQPFDGFNFYRLTLLLENGETRQSGIRVVTFQPIGNFVAFPNPAFSEVFVKIPSSEEASELQIIDRQGRLMWTEEVPPGEEIPHRLDVSMLEEGLYCLVLNQVEKRSKTLRLVVMRK